jgi:hypothetical protein
LPRAACGGKHLPGRLSGQIRATAIEHRERLIIGEDEPPLTIKDHDAIGHAAEHSCKEFLAFAQLTLSGSDAGDAPPQESAQAGPERHHQESIAVGTS